MKIKELPSMVDEQIKRLKFDQLLTLSNGQDISEIMHQSVALFPNLKKRNKQTFLDFFKASLLEGTCYGQVCSLMAKEGKLQHSKIQAHILDAIRIQILHEVSWDLQIQIDERDEEEECHLVQRKEKINDRDGLKLKKVHVVAQEKENSSQQLIEKIRAVTKSCFTKFEKKQVIVEMRDNDRGIDFLNKKDNVQRQLGTVDDIKNVLEESHELYVVGSIIPVNCKSENGHEFCLMKKRERFHLYDISDKSNRVYRTYAKVERMFKKLSNNIQAAFSVPIAYIKYTVYSSKK